MNTYYKVISYLRSYLEKNPNVNTVVYADGNNFDLNEKNIYPIVYINPQSAPISDNTGIRSYTFEIAALDQRDISNEYMTDKFTGNDNQIDNHNICDTILYDLYMYIKDGDNDENIELGSASDLSVVQTPNVNILDGWVFTITLKIPNNQC